MDSKKTTAADAEERRIETSPNSPPIPGHSPAVSPPLPSVTMEIHSVNALGYWSWNVQNETCAICRNTIMECCVNCLASQERLDSENPTLSLGNESRCPYQKGTCNHVFHQHCISRWLRTRFVCPLCNQEWSSQYNP